MSWIPVEERLPEKEDYYRVTMVDGVESVFWYNPTREEWSTTSGIKKRFNPIAWHPNPAPYVKPRRFVVEMVAGSLALRPYFVRDTVDKMVISDRIPTHEAAQRIADIYEEAYRGE